MAANPQSQQIKQNFMTHPYVQQLNRTVQGQVNSLDAELNKYPVLRDIEAKTKVPKAYGALTLGASAVLLIFFNLFGLALPISNLIGWGLPAYFSIHAIESPSTNDDKQWLTYWIVFGTFNLIESLALRFVLYWIPMYFVFKTVFVIWLFLPATRGAEVLYFNVLRPVTGNIKARAQGPISSRQPASSTFGSSTKPTSSTLNSSNTFNSTSSYNSSTPTYGTSATASSFNPTPAAPLSSTTLEHDKML